MDWLSAYAQAEYAPLLLLAPLGVMAVSDVRRREVGLGWMVTFIIGSLMLSAWANGLRGMATNLLWNVLLVVYLGLGVIVYLRLRRGRWINPLRGHTGEGDLLLALGMAPLFAPREYLLVLLAGLVVSLLWWVGMALRKQGEVTVPLVTTLGGTVGAYLIYCAL